MPDVSPSLLTCIPIVFRDGIADGTRCIVLIATEYFQHAISPVSYGVEADHAVRHWNGEEHRCNLFPVIDRLIVGVCPMEVIVSIEPATLPRIGKVKRFFRVHRHKDLHQRE